MEKIKSVYGIGNPLIDIIVGIGEREMSNLGIHKGTMQLISRGRLQELDGFVKDRKAAYSCGGSCPNTLVTLAALGVPVTLAGKIGHDRFGEIYTEKLGTQPLVRDDLRRCSEPTGRSIIFVTEDSERTMNTYLGANREYGPEDVDADAARQADFFHFTGYMWDTPSQKAAIRKALEAARSGGAQVSFDIADPFAVSRYREDFLNLIRRDCDIVYANNEEARILFDNYDAYECCRSMGKLCSTAVVKNGKKGSFVSHNGAITRIAVSGPNEAADTTGAGDIYAAGFLYGLCRGLAIEKCGAIASYLAGEIITQIGAQFSPEKIPALKARLEAMA